MADPDGADMQDFDLDSSVNRDWAEFQRRLADYLAAMRDEDLLVLESGFEELDESQGLMPCIQFVVWDGDTVRCEVPSNHYLHPDRALTDAEQTYLTELGWNRPTRGPDDEPDDGSPAFYVDKKLSWSDQLAAMAVAAFRDVWGITHPAFLSTETSSTDPEATFDPVALRPPLVAQLDPGAAVVPRDAEHLHELITLSLVPMLGLLPERDPDGDVPIRMGNTILFVGPLADSVDVQLFAPLVHDISDRTRAAEVTADLNRTWSRIKFVLVDDRLSAFLEVSGNPFVPQHLTDTCKTFAEFLRTVDGDFAARFGGELFFTRESASDEDLEPEPGGRTESRMSSTDLPKELLTLFHLDPGPADASDPAVVADVCGHDRDRILALLDTGTAWVSQLRDTDDASADHWERVVGTLRHALRTVVLPPTSAPDTKPQPEQMGLFTNPEE
ncbi:MULTISPECIES: T3SS (YopN, CesT) and YbjN peptide-binding chaperone 1 [unclassified Rhodococcus (in: high G+C Gram-positive bacteria)]|uniref:T3SS (YopN, CesT) and YbjN peptide-binding chaperone 1 n=1 Tax=unclassified Rhodococcus (in: high G+C Gram-positive bacteria) TaxID=192944 RepID=UPI00163B4515|nr:MULTISPECIES: hypothetical protein [unclassified Rhodococcus (in: high G+C Gram-positive bacteria)]MBC2639033.1 hypothetical protein [Rhodococcus sp. 3A]MBC2896225.1 hypothetical protein [Rhodococcus sp. 4CII]